MKVKDAVAYFGSKRKVADVLGLTIHAVYMWGKDDDDIPQRRAYELERLSGGALVVDNAPEPIVPSGPSEAS